MEGFKRICLKKTLAFLMSMAMVLVMSAPTVFAAAASTEKKVLDPGNLSDGEYTVGIEMIKLDQRENVDKENCGRSMANGSIEHEAKVIVKNGKAYFNMNFGYLDLFGKRGYLGKFYVNSAPLPKSNFIDEEYKKGYKDVDVLEYVLDEHGQKYVDEYNDPNGEIAKEYPKCRVDYARTIGFPLPKYAMETPNGFISCQVIVPVMESMGGFGTQQVLIRIAWNGGFTEAAGKKINLEPLKAIKMQQTVEANGASVTGMLPADSKLEVSKIDKDLDILELAKQKKCTVLAAYDVKMDKKLSDSIHLTLKVDNVKDGDAVKVFHIHDNKSTEEYDRKVKDGSVDIEISSFSKFLIAKENPKENDGKNPSGERKNTGTSGSTKTPENTKTPESTKTPVNGEVVVNHEKEKTAVPSEDKTFNFSNLKNGTYSVTGEMIKTNRKDKSMSNKGFNKNVKLRVENGKYFVTLSFKGINIGGKLGYLGKMKYYDDKGKLSDVKVVETVQYDGKTYPTTVEVPLNSEGRTKGWQKLQVFVQAMEDIAKGSGTQDVYLRLYPDTVKANYNPAETNFGTTNKVSTSAPAASLKTPKTGDKTGLAGAILMLIAGVTTVTMVEVKKRKMNHR